MRRPIGSGSIPALVRLGVGSAYGRSGSRGSVRQIGPLETCARDWSVGGHHSFASWRCRIGNPFSHRVDRCREGDFPRQCRSLHRDDGGDPRRQDCYGPSLQDRRNLGKHADRGSCCPYRCHPDAVSPFQRRSAAENSRACQKFASRLRVANESNKLPPTVVRDCKSADGPFAGASASINGYDAQRHSCRFSGQATITVSKFRATTTFFAVHWLTASSGCSVSSKHATQYFGRRRRG